jgi:hypothetical protein
MLTSKKLLRLGLVLLAVLLSGLMTGMFALAISSAITPPGVMVAIVFVTLTLVYVPLFGTLRTGLARLACGLPLVVPSVTDRETFRTRLSRVLMVHSGKAILIIAGVYLLTRGYTVVPMILFAGSLTLGFIARIKLHKPVFQDPDDNSLLTHKIGLPPVTAAALLVTPVFAAPMLAALSVYFAQFQRAYLWSIVAGVLSCAMIPVLFWSSALISREFGIPNELKAQTH